MPLQHVVAVAHDIATHASGFAGQAPSFHRSAYDGQNGRDVPVQFVEPEARFAFPKQLEISRLKTGDIDDFDR
jgi:hypothetical protein